MQDWNTPMMTLWPRQSPCVVIGHRGAMGYAPENTLSSFEEALRRGADLIEMDVQLSADNEVVVMHDTSVGRTTNGEGFSAGSCPGKKLKRWMRARGLGPTMRMSSSLRWKT